MPDAVVSLIPVLLDPYLSRPTVQVITLPRTFETSGGQDRPLVLTEKSLLPVLRRRRTWLVHPLVYLLVPLPCIKQPPERLAEWYVQLLPRQPVVRLERVTVTSLLARLKHRRCRLRLLH